MINFINQTKEKVTNLFDKACQSLFMKKNQLSTGLQSQRKGAVAFEYIIILVFMVVIIVAAWNLLQPVIIAKVQDVTNAVNSANPGGGTR